MRLLDKKSFGAALLYFTGSKEHNVVLRGRANDMGYTLNEYALATLKGEQSRGGARPKTRSTRSSSSTTFRPSCAKIPAKSTAAEAAASRTSSSLATFAAICRCTRTASDGKNSIEEMAEAARALGYEYIALTDHSKGRHRRQRPRRKAHARAHQENSRRAKNAFTASACSPAAKWIS